MTLAAEQLVSNVDIIERVEKSTLRMETQALLDFVEEARRVWWCAGSYSLGRMLKWYDCHSLVYLDDSTSVIYDCTDRPTIGD